MANPLRAEVEVELGGKMRRLIFNGNAIAEIECELREGVSDVMAEMSRDFESNRIGRLVSRLRAFLWAGMHQVNRGIKIEKVGEAMATDLKSLGRYLEACAAGITEAMGLNDPETKARIEKAKQEAADPLAAATVATEAAVESGSTSGDSGEKPSSVG